MHAPAKPAPKDAAPARMIAPRMARAIALLIGLALSGFIYLNDRHLTGVHAMAVTAAIGATLALLTRRILLSAALAAALAAALVAFVSSIAYIKRARTDFILHAWDLFDTGLWRFSPREIAAANPLASGVLAIAILVVLIAPIALLLREQANVRRLHALAALIVFAAVGALSARVDGGPQHTQYTWADRNLSSFYSSWPEALETLARGQLIEAAPGDASASLAPFDPRPACTPETRPPHIILIHQESVTPPAPLKGLDYDRGLDAFFRSHDGRNHAMRVETYGGASWLTEFSVLTGAASRFFGSIRQFVQIYMAGRMDDALPTVLARCGYQNMMFYPYLKGFFGSARFFETVGLRQIFDARDQKAPSSMERDSFYYANMLGEIGRRVEASKDPLFIYLQTMSVHWPYDVTYWPEREAPGGGPGTNPEMHEYLRRLAMAQKDYAALLKDLAARFPAERFLVVHYGDHHPLATRHFFGFDAQPIEQINDALPEGSPAFVTYYAVDGVNYSPPPLPDVAVLDSAWLGAIVLEQARLPMPDSWRERARLMRACDGAYALCPDRDAILRFHRRMIESGIVTAR
ncbi:MAG: sulfatase-like hydrolase/transferase [Beijerinckiaceae bacterium]|nr:sulfatase-like hydrolase/transferase [Beijerinckiaceae bacterium]